MDDTYALPLLAVSQPCQPSFPVVVDKTLDSGDNLIKIGQIPRVVRHPLVLYGAALVNDKDGALGQTFEASQVFVLNPILGNDLFVVIAQQGKIDAYLLGECLVAKGSIGADANDFGI